MMKDELNILWSQLGFQDFQIYDADRGAIAIKKFEIEDYDFETRYIMGVDVFRAINFVHGVTVHSKIAKDEMDAIIATMNFLNSKGDIGDE